MIAVEMSVPYLSLGHLVSAIATAVSRADSGQQAPQPSDEAIAAAALVWESKLRELAEGQAIQGHDFDTLVGRPWYLLDIERDVFYVNDLNECPPLRNAGFRFAVVSDPREGLHMQAAFAEATYNPEAISWRYWVEHMPTLTAAQAARLMCGLDPDVYADLSDRPMPKNDVEGVCGKAAKLERLAIAQDKLSDTAPGWLQWARAHRFVVHVGFALAVEEKAAEGVDASSTAPANGQHEGAPLTESGIGLRVLPPDVDPAAAQTDRLERALVELEARKTAAAEFAAGRTPHSERLAALQEKLDALPQHERRTVLDAAGQHRVSAAPKPIEPIRGGGYVAPRLPAVQPPRWPLWLALTRVALWEAVALVLNIDPRSLKHSRNGWMAGPNRGPFFEPKSFPSEAKWEAFEEALSFAKKAAAEGGSISVQMGFPTTHTGIAEVLLREVVAFFVSVDWPDIPEELLTLASGPEPETAQSAPVLETSGRENWRTLAKEYMAQKLRAGRYAKAKEFEAALRACLNEPDSPFEAGTGENRGHLVLRKTGKKLDLKTIQNNWGELRTAAGQR